MRKFLIAAVAAAALSGAANASLFFESGTNKTQATADSIDGSFDLAFSPDIGDFSSNTSTTIPHVTIDAHAENGTYDWFKFTAQAGSTGIFDIDYALDGSDGPGGFDANVHIYDVFGNHLDGSDDSATSAGQGGSGHPYDSFLQYVFASTGVYFVQVGNCCYPVPFTVYNGDDHYQLQVSIQNHQQVPEPAPIALLGLGLAGLAAARRRRKA